MSDIQSISRQEQADREYVAAWEAMPQSTKDRLARGGVDGPAILAVPSSEGTVIVDADRGGDEDIGEESDVSEWLERSKTAVFTWDVAADVDKLHDELKEQFSVGGWPKVADYVDELTRRARIETHSLLLARIVGLLLSGTRNLQASIHGLAHAVPRLAELNGLHSMRQSGTICGVSHEWIRRSAWSWVKLLGLPRLLNAKTPEACAAYSEDKLSNHWRKQKCKS